MALFQLWNNGYLRLKSRYNKLQYSEFHNIEKNPAPILRIY